MKDKFEILDQDDELPQSRKSKHITKLEADDEIPDIIPKLYPTTINSKQNWIAPKRESSDEAVSLKETSNTPSPPSADSLRKSKLVLSSHQA